MNIQELKASLPFLFEAELTGFIWGSAGIGKSSVVKQYAEEKGYHFFPFYLGTQSDIGDILGLADFVRDDKGTAVATTFATPKWLKDTIDYCNENPESGAIIFLDEFNRARRDILSGIFSLALDKTFHTIKLPKNCHVIAAGNPPTDDYVVTDVNDTALMSRFVHIKLQPTLDEWLSYADSRNVDTSLTGFIKEQPELLQDARQDFNLPIKVDARAWERLNKVFKLNPPKQIQDQLAQGIIGLERFVAFTQYLAKTDRPLTAAEILAGEKKELLHLWANPENTQSSFLNISCDNLKKELFNINKQELKLTPAQKENMMVFFTIVPKDIVYPLLTKLVDARLAAFRDFFLDPLYESKMTTWVKVAKGIEQ